MNKKKMARICWNSNNWIKPSGKIGKSLNNSFELDNAFGHEEWLFDLDKLIEGHHFSYLQSIDENKQKLYSGEYIDILLFTIKTIKKNITVKYWVGWINNAYVLSFEESKEIYEKYKENKWLDEMKNDLLYVEAKYKTIYSSKNIFNVKFLPEDFHWINGTDLQEFSENEKLKASYYNLYDINNNDFKKLIEQKYEIVKKSRSSKTKNVIGKSSEGYNKEYENIHGKLLDAFYEYLDNLFPMKVSKEAIIKPTNNRIDIYQETDDKNIIYEIKAYPDLKHSFRIALGQLLEYGYYPNRDKKYKLVLVSYKNIEKQLKEYIDNLNIMFNIDIGIVCFNYNLNMIIDKYNCEHII